MRTIAYIDGFNLYYGCLRGSQYKWIDIYKLCQRIGTDHNPHTALQQVKFFTADVKANLSLHGQASTQSQQTYHRALSALYPKPKIEIIKGFYSVQKAYFHPYEKPIPLNRKIAVWRPEEKLTDVNIAIHMCRDAINRNCDAMLLFTNDTDIAPAIEAVKEFNSTIEIGVVFPRREGTNRPPSGKLAELSDWTQQYIKNDELASSLMNDLIPTRKKPAIKPDYW